MCVVDVCVYECVCVGGDLGVCLGVVFEVFAFVPTSYLYMYRYETYNALRCLFLSHPQSVIINFLSPIFHSPITTT